MISRENFEKYLSSLISEEEKKILNKNVLIKTCVSIGLLFLAIIFTFLSLAHNNIVTILFATLFAFLSLLFISNRKSGAYTKLEQKYKDKVLDYLLKDIPHKYYKKNYIPENVFEEAQLVSSYDRYTGEDLIVMNIPNDDGTQSETSLFLSDVVATKQVYDENDERYKTETRYRGVLGYVEFPNEFKCRLTLNRNNYGMFTGLDKVQLESIDFNKKFSIRTSDQIEARYMLTPDTMLKLLSLQDREKNIQFVLDGRYMYISIPYKNLFNLKTNAKEVDGKTFMRFYDDISLILDLIKEIQKNNKVFKM